MTADDDLLADLAAGRVGAGTYRWDAAHDVAGLQRVVEESGGRLVRLDTSTATTRAEALEALGEALDLPPWWGRNLDALADCLRDLADQPAAGRIVLLWDGWASLADQDPRTSTLATRLLGDAGLVVLLRGAAPT